jgi:hypothetical protein
MSMVWNMVVQASAVSQNIPQPQRHVDPEGEAFGGAAQSGSLQ